MNICDSWQLQVFIRYNLLGTRESRQEGAHDIYDANVVNHTIKKIPRNILRNPLVNTIYDHKTTSLDPTMFDQRSSKILYEGTTF